MIIFFQNHIFHTILAKIRVSYYFRLRSIVLCQLCKALSNKSSRLYREYDQTSNGTKFAQSSIQINANLLKNMKDRRIEHARYITARAAENPTEKIRKIKRRSYVTGIRIDGSTVSAETKSLEEVTLNKNRSGKRWQLTAFLTTGLTNLAAANISAELLGCFHEQRTWNQTKAGQVVHFVMGWLPGPRSLRNSYT